MSIRPSKTPPASPAKTAPEPSRTLAQEKSDFTAEGSPPPGQVAGTVPLLPADEPVPPLPGTPSKGAARARRRPPSPTGPVGRPVLGNRRAMSKDDD